jgi:serine/threonine protein kinase
MTENRHTPSSRFAETMLPGTTTPRPGAVQESRKQQVQDILPPLPFQIESWIVTEIHASGGMGVTFLGTEEGNPEHRIVLKMPLTFDPDIIERFRNEIRVLSELDHPNIVKFVGSGEVVLEIAGQSCQLPWLAMEYVAGQSLRAKLLTSKRMSWQETFAFLESVLGGLVYLHRRNLCHRDIKPDNLIYDPVTRNWKLVDFGIAKNMVANPQLTMTIAQSDPGALDYMSPEQIAGEQVDTRSDIYSLGKTAWEALIGQVPRVGTPYPSVELGTSAVPADVDKLIEKMVAHRPEARFQEPSEVLEALATGMSVIDRKKRAQIRNTKVRRTLKLTVASAAILLCAAVVLKGLGEQKAEDCVKDLSPVSAIHKLNSLNWFWRFCGRIKINKELDELGPGADREKTAMVSAHDHILADSQTPPLDDQQKSDLCDNFLKSYATDFAGTQQVLDIQTKKDDLLVALVTKKVNDLLAAAGDAEKKGDAAQAQAKTQQALQLCDDAKSQVAGSTPRIEISNLRNQTAVEYSKAQLVKIRQDLNENDQGSVVQAQRATVQLEKELLGANSETQAFLGKLDDALWKMQTDQYKVAFDHGDYTQAREALDRYAEISEIKGHKRQLDEMLAALRQTEDETDWKTIGASAQQNFDQQAFHLAKLDYDNYLGKWKDRKGKHVAEAQSGLAKVTQAQFEHLLHIEDFDDYRAALRQCMDDYPNEKDNIVAGQRILVNKAYGLMLDAWNAAKGDDKASLGTALDRVGQINWELAETDKRQYLGTLRDAMSACLRDPGQQSALRAIYYFERPPADCIKLKTAPTVYLITPQSVSVEMSDALFGSLKRTWSPNAKPRLIVNVCSNDQSKNYPTQAEVSSDKEGIESKSITQALPQTGIYFDTASQDIQIIFKDEAMWGGFKDIVLIGSGSDLIAHTQLTWTSEGTNIAFSFTSQ